MKVIDKDIVVCFDVDDTLIDYFPEKGEPVYVVEAEPGNKREVKAIYGNVDELKRHKNQGQVIVVWSNAGYRWAAAVVRALGIEDYVDYVMCKPKWIYDDIDPAVWLGKPRFFGDKR